ncbi:TrbG/VirB9 family P-type conjugative transfer protein [Novosphingobium sp.]|uniref:TrbG/VirB9 family P-type conjugative transfer protein n=1 Tax=Novosphingobium sp. TaxID=1874826 RepID=UPI003D12253F
MIGRLKVSVQLLAAVVAAIGACSSMATRAQQAPVSSAEDNRIAILRYIPGSPAQLHAIAGVELSVLMPRGEHVQRVIVGDPSAVRVEVPSDHDGIVLSALRSLNDVALSVETEQQSYQFSVSVNLQGTVPWLIRLERGGGMVHNIFPTAPLSVGAPPPPQPPGEWKLKGDKALEPVMIRDNGEKVSIKWSSMQAIPAVFALDDHGQEQMVNGYMRADVFVIDRVFDHLVFRIDKAIAHADRAVIEPKK